MEQQLAIEERIHNAIRLGESHFREFKSAYEGPPGNRRPRQPVSICKDIAEVLVSFGNADGGELLIGVEDDGTISGVSHIGSQLETILQAPETHVHGETPLSP